MLPAAFPELKTDLLVKLAQSSDPALQTEAVRTLQQSPRREALPVLLQLASDAAADVSLRAEAISALCGLVPHEEPLPAEVESLLSRFAVARLPVSGPNDNPTVVSTLQLEAIRALRGRATEGTPIRKLLETLGAQPGGLRPPLSEAVELTLTGKSPSGSSLSSLDSGLPSSGRRVFFSHQGPLCFKCHTVQGRGGNVGPDLSVIARTMDRQKLLDSLLDPSKEISPQYLTWSVSTTDGKVHTGIIVTENGAGDIDLGDAQGNVIKIPRQQIDERVPSKVSVMPLGLHQRMTTQELADLLAYLETLK
jgi:putative heme-binding domain-containing protein